MSCSLRQLLDNECGSVSSSLNVPLETQPLSLCTRDVSRHLQTTSITDISKEYDLILARAGVFEYDDNYLLKTTVCPKHRYQLGSGWYQKRICRHPYHEGKAKPDRTINKSQSRLLVDETSILVQVGSGTRVFILYLRIQCNTC